MNRRKKMKQKVLDRKKNPPKKIKPKYISKADRAKLEAANQEEKDNTPDQ